MSAAMSPAGRPTSMHLCLPFSRVCVDVPRPGGRAARRAGVVTAGVAAVCGVVALGSGHKSPHTYGYAPAFAEFERERRERSKRQKFERERRERSRRKAAEAELMSAIEHQLDGIVPGQGKRQRAELRGIGHSLDLVPLFVPSMGVYVPATLPAWAASFHHANFDDLGHLPMFGVEVADDAHHHHTQTAYQHSGRAAKK